MAHLRDRDANHYVISKTPELERKEELEGAGGRVHAGRSPNKGSDFYMISLKKRVSSAQIF